MNRYERWLPVVLVVLVITLAIATVILVLYKSPQRVTIKCSDPHVHVHGQSVEVSCP